MTYGAEVSEDTNKTKSMLKDDRDEDIMNNSGENKERQSEKYEYQRAMRNMRCSER